jgi:hypothetical protein
LLWHIADLAWSLALLSAGSNMDIKSDIIAITTNSSISVKPRRLCIPDPAGICGKINNNCYYTLYTAHNQADDPCRPVPKGIQTYAKTDTALAPVERPNCPPTASSIVDNPKKYANYRITVDYSCVNSYNNGTSIRLRKA